MKQFYMNRIKAEEEIYLSKKNPKRKDLDVVLYSLISIAMTDECLTDAEFRDIVNAAILTRKSAIAQKMFERLNPERNF